MLKNRVNKKQRKKRRLKREQAELTMDKYNERMAKAPALKAQAVRLTKFRRRKLIAMRRAHAQAGSQTFSSAKAIAERIMEDGEEKKRRDSGFMPSV